MNRRLFYLDQTPDPGLRSEVPNPFIQEALDNDCLKRPCQLYIVFKSLLINPLRIQCLTQKPKRRVIPASPSSIYPALQATELRTSKDFISPLRVHALSFSANS